jgi:hypothetical protein
MLPNHKIVISWKYDGDTSFVTDECCHEFETNTIDSNIKHQVDIMGTYNMLLKEGGCTPESALKQTSQCVDRFRRWHADQWNYVGCVVTLYERPLDCEDEDTWEESSQESVWGIESDCGKEYKQEVEADLLERLCHYSLVSCDYNRLDARRTETGIFLAEGSPVEITEDSEVYMHEPPKEEQIDQLPMGLFAIRPKVGISGRLLGSKNRYITQWLY